MQLTMDPNTTGAINNLKKVIIENNRISTKQNKLMIDLTKGLYWFTYILVILALIELIRII